MTGPEDCTDDAPGARTGIRSGFVVGFVAGFVATDDSKFWTAAARLYANTPPDERAESVPSRPGCTRVGLSANVRHDYVRGALGN